METKRNITNGIQIEIHKQAMLDARKSHLRIFSDVAEVKKNMLIN